MFINHNNLLKYIIQLIIVSVASYCLSPCKVNCNFALLLGLISSSLFALIDNYYPTIVYQKNLEEARNHRII